MHYVPPQKSEIGDAAAVKQPVRAVWNRLVDKLAADFFIIDKLDEDTRTINVSFKTSPAAAYVDCGTTTRKFIGVDGQESVFTYKTADNARYQVARDDRVYLTDRNTSVTGHADIALEPENGETKISVSVRFNFSTMYEVSQLGRNAPMLRKLTQPASFTTKTPYVGPIITCRSNGEIEQRVLEYAHGGRLRDQRELKWHYREAAHTEELPS